MIDERKLIEYINDGIKSATVFAEKSFGDGTFGLWCGKIAAYNDLLYFLEEGIDIVKTKE